jgi:hypothetical protein
MSCDSAVLQLAYRAKQDCPGHQNPLMILKAFDDKRLCPVAHLEEYLNHTSYQRNCDSLLLTTTVPFDAAAKSTIKRWII